VSDLHDLIRACKAEPDDDAPRLILADWLEEHGQGERAAFIRAQIARPDDSPIEPNLEWAGQWKRWADNWHATQSLGALYPLTCRRGFFRVGDYYRELYGCLPQLLQPPFDWTWLDEIQFGSWHDGDWAPLFESACLRELTCLAFNDDHYRSNLIGPLLTSPHLQSLRRLELMMVVVTDEDIERLSECNTLAGLRSIQMTEMHFGPVAARAIARSELWDGLVTCSLQASRIGDHGLTEFAQGPARPRLQHLNLTIGAYTDDGLKELARSDRFPAVTELGIGFRDCGEPATSFGRAGIEAILRSPNFARAKVTVSIISESPVPTDLGELQQENQHRLTIWFRNPRKSLQYKTWAPASAKQT
jgi:uncharacterized protein (TIGR02996 family)